MSFSKQTENKNWKSTDTFCWNEADVLGKGATAVVYKARRKVNINYNRCISGSYGIMVVKLRILLQQKLIETAHKYTEI